MRTARFCRWAALVWMTAVPGTMAWSCSGTLSRDIRDAAIAGLTSFVEAQTFDLLDLLFPETATEE